jgi:DNA-binding NtrC family response regulator
MSASVLVVEDYADLRSAIVTTLVRDAFVCDQVTTSAQAIAKLRSRHYSAILLSPTLPISSDPVMHFLVEEQPDEVAKVILMTEPGNAEAAGDPDCRHLSKPFNHEQLLAQLALR